MTNDSEIQVWIPIDPEDLGQIEGLLEASDVFTTTFQDLGETRFRAETYLREQLAGTSMVVRLDRNLLTRILALARGEPATEPHRIAAAVQAFAQTLGILIEPNLALYEVTASSDDARPNEERRAFRRVDNTHPQLFADVAVGRSPVFEVDQLADPPDHLEKDVDFTMALRVWRASYTAVLKIAALELTTGPAERKVVELLEWMEDEFLFIGPAVLLANRYLAPNRSRRGLLKSLRSADRTRALSGIQNAAWDLALVYEWAQNARQQTKQKSLWILASLDRSVHSIARSFVVAAESDEDVHFLLREEFARFWGAGTGERLVNIYLECVERCGTRGSNADSRTLEPSKAVELLRDLEAEVLEYEI